MSGKLMAHIQKILLASFVVLCFVFALTLSQAIASGELDYQRAKTSFEAGDARKAAEYLIRAVDQGHSAARLPLAAMYRDGVGVEKNYEMAFKLFKISAEEGYPSAQYGLAELYRLGEGVERSYKTSMEWYRRAALQADPEAQNSLGVVYEYGRGLEYSYEKARMWYEIAGINGSKRGERNAKRLSRKMKPHQIAKAKKMSLQCLSSNYDDCG